MIEAGKVYANVRSVSR